MPQELLNGLMGIGAGVIVLVLIFAITEWIKR